MEFDIDLTARQEARELAWRAETAQRKLTELSQSQLDAIVEAVAKAFAAQAAALAEMAVQETGFGNAEDKRAKNLFASQRVAEAVRGMKTVGILREVPEKKLWEIGVPVGVIAAIIPSTRSSTPPATARPPMAPSSARRSGWGSKKRVVINSTPPTAMKRSGMMYPSKSAKEQASRIPATHQPSRAWSDIS